MPSWLCTRQVQRQNYYNPVLAIQVGHSRRVAVYGEMYGRKWVVGLEGHAGQRCLESVVGKAVDVII